MVFAGLFAVGVGGGLAAWRFGGQANAQPSGAPPTESATVAGNGPAPAAPSEAATAPSPSATSAPVSFPLSVGPAGVKVELDGADVTVEDGKVSIRGTLGSVHRVVLRLGAREQAVQVALTEQGPSPDTLVLGKPSTSRVAATPGATGATPAATSAPTTPPTTRPVPTRTSGVGAVDSFE
jgi:hypothetical protein